MPKLKPIKFGFLSTIDEPLLPHFIYYAYKFDVNDFWDRGKISHGGGQCSINKKHEYKSLRLANMYKVDKIWIACPLWDFL